MGNYKDLLPSQQGWIHELARAEVHPEAEHLLNLGSSSDPQQVVEESAVNFLTELREAFQQNVRVFNSYSEGGARFSEVKLYSIAQSAADFMIFRNQIKLVVTNVSHGVIQLIFNQHLRGNFGVDGQYQAQDSRSEAPASAELIAQIGPFRDVHWTFRGEKVSAEQVAKFYFAEFARATRDSRRQRGNNQLLLDQIKALLQEKGLDL
jgi:hypothetical protein